MAGKGGNTRRGLEGPDRRPIDWPKWRRGLGLLLLLTALGGSTAWGVTTLRDPTVMPLKIVRIDGDFKQLDRRDLERTVSSAMEGNFFTVDLDSVRQAALKLAWVDQVMVRRIWPDTLNMRVVEQEPLARWGESALVNERGDIFSPGSLTQNLALPTLQGPPAQAAEVVTYYKRMSSRFGALKLHINRLSIDGRGAWTVGFSEGIELKLGHEETAVRLDRFVRLYPRLDQVETRKIKRVDMRYSNGVAVLWGEAS